MEILSEMPGEFKFGEFYDRVLHALKAVNSAMHGTVTKQGESQLRDECDAFLMNLPRNVFAVAAVSKTVKRNGYVAVTDPKSIPNPDYVSCPVESPYVSVPPPAGATKRPTLRDFTPACPPACPPAWLRDNKRVTIPGICLRLRPNHTPPRRPICETCEPKTSRYHHAYWTHRPLTRHPESNVPPSPWYQRGLFFAKT